MDVNGWFLSRMYPAITRQQLENLCERWERYGQIWKDHLVGGLEHGFYVS